MAFQKYEYAPSMTAAVIFTVLFSIAALLHHYQMVRTRTWFMIPFCLGGICEIIGYIGRAISASQEYGEWTSGPYIMQTILLLVAPALFSASIYMELGRIVNMLEADSLLFIRRTWLTKIFVSGDIISFLTQGAGAGLLASSDTGDTASTGKDIVVAGLCIQIIFFALFVLAAGIFHIRLMKTSTDLAPVMPWRRHMYSLYVVSILIFIRSIVRVIELIQGTDGYIISHEVFLYVFAATMMFFVMVNKNGIHPSVIAKAIREKMGEKGKIAKLAQGENAV